MKKTATIKERLKTIRVKIPVKLYDQIHRLVDEGWFRSQEDIVDDAIRRFLNTHRPELMEQYVLEDVEWGLRGGK